MARKQTSSSTDDPYEILGVDRDATAEEIERAFKRKASKHHPDRVDQNDPEAVKRANDEMTRINTAYRTLTDDGARAELDEFGTHEPEDPDSIDGRARRALQHLFGQFLDASEILQTSHDPIVGMTQATIEGQGNIRRALAQHERTLKRLEKYRKRIKRRDGRRPSLLLNVLEERLKGLRSQIEDAKRDVQIGDAVLEILQHYDWENDPDELSPLRIGFSFKTLGHGG